VTPDSPRDAWPIADRAPDPQAAGGPILLDLSRLLSRASRPTPTGIDRIELAYAEYLMAHAGGRLRFVAMTAAGDWSPIRQRYGRALVQSLAQCWRDPDNSGRTARRLGLLTTLSALVPGPPASLPAGSAAGRPVYLLVSHQNLHRRARLAQFKQRSGCAFVPFLHDLIPLHFPEYSKPGQAERHRERLDTICALADGVIVNSQDTADALAPHLAGCGRDVPVLVAHPGAEFARDSAPPAEASAAPYFVCIGTIEPRKNHLLLLHLWRQLAQRKGADAPRLILIGQRGWLNANILDMLDRCATIRPLIEEHNSLPDRDLRPLLAGARALLCPSFVEGYGLPIAEALALGVPVICSDLAVFREVGRGVPEYLDPLDGLGWMQAIGDYAATAAPRRRAQLARLREWQAPGWDGHMAAVMAFVRDIGEKKGLLF
jgi:glycosyltransferase involved in cell wall biosynthesis